MHKNIYFFKIWFLVWIQYEITLHFFMESLIPISLSPTPSGITPPPYEKASLSFSVLSIILSQNGAKFEIIGQNLECDEKQVFDFFL